MKNQAICLIIFISLFMLPSPKLAQNDFKDFYDFLDRFETEGTNQTQLIEDYIQWQEEYGFPAIVNNTHAVFIYYTGQNHIGSAQIAGDFNSWNPEDMIRLGSFNFFYFPLNAEATARLDYKFIVDGNWILDPRNPHTVPGGFGDNSELAMPEFIQPTEIIYRKNIDHGNLTFIKTEFKSANPGLTVYLPPNFQNNNSYPTAYFTDGSEYLSLAYSATILDNLIHDGKIKPIIGIFVDPWGQRHEWYNCSSMKYLEYLDELVSFIDNRYPTIANRTERLHLGDSLGGQISAFVGLQRNNLFKNIGMQSGAFWDGDTSLGRIGCQIKDQYKNASSNLNLSMWFTAGTYEQTIYEDTQAMVQIAKEKNWITNVTYYHEGHSWGLWRHTLDEMLEFFFPMVKEPTIFI